MPDAYAYSMYMHSVGGTDNIGTYCDNGVRL